MEEEEPEEKNLLPPARGVDAGSVAPQADKPGPGSVTPGSSPAQPPLGLVPLLRPAAGLGSQAWRPQGSSEGTVTAHHAAGEPEAQGDGDSAQVLPTPALGRAWLGPAREEAAHGAGAGSRGTPGRPPQPCAPSPDGKKRCFAWQW